MDINQRVAHATQAQLRLALSNVMLGLAELGFGTDKVMHGNNTMESIDVLFNDTLNRCLPSAQPAPSAPTLGVDPETMAPPWTSAHAGAALKEGWIISECFGSAYGPWQVQRRDDASEVPGTPQLENDEIAWDIVLAGSADHHAAARAFMKAHNPEDFKTMLARSESTGVAFGGSVQR